MVKKMNKETLKDFLEMFKGMDKILQIEECIALEEHVARLEKIHTKYFIYLKIGKKEEEKLYNEMLNIWMPIEKY